MNNNVIIIAEAGVNHNGVLENAFKLVDVAKDAGVDFVKFQTFKTELVISKYAKKAFMAPPSFKRGKRTALRLSSKMIIVLYPAPRNFLK